MPTMDSHVGFNRVRLEVTDLIIANLDFLLARQRDLHPDVSSGQHCWVHGSRKSELPH